MSGVCGWCISPFASSISIGWYHSFLLLSISAWMSSSICWRGLGLACPASLSSVYCCWYAVKASARLLVSWHTLYALIMMILLSHLPFVVAKANHPILSLPVWLVRVTQSPVMERRLPPGWYLHWGLMVLRSKLSLLG